MAKTPCSQCRGPRFDPWSGTISCIPQPKILHAVPQTQHSQKTKQKKPAWVSQDGTELLRIGEKLLSGVSVCGLITQLRSYRRRIWYGVWAE